MKILLFGITRDIVGKDTLSGQPFSQAKTIENLKDVLRKEYPEIAKITSLAFAVNEEYARDETPINQNDEVAVIPPVSGG